MKQYIYSWLSFIASFFFVFNVSAFWKVSLDTEFSYYLAPVQFINLSQNIVNIRPRVIYSSQHKNNLNYFYTNLSALVSSELSDSHAVIPELFFLYNLQSTKFKKSTLIFGRKKINWSLLEEDWKLGLLGSNFQVNPLRPETQGLLGVFYKYAISDFLLRLFVSPIFLPNQSGTVDVRDGKIHIYNRWNSFIYYDTVLGRKVYYSLDSPNIYNFLQQWSLGFWAKKKISKVYLTASYFYKPYAAPYIYANISDRVEVEGSTPTLNILVKVKPVMHHIAFFELQLKQKNFSQYFSLVLDKPQKLSFVDEAKYSALVDKNILAAGIKYTDLIRSINLGGIYTQFNIIQQSVFSMDKDLRGIDDIYGYPYKTAFFLQANQKNILFSSDALFIKYTHIFTSKVEVLSIKYTKILKKHSLVLGFDILGHPFSEQVGGIFAGNIANDFVYVGWNYVF